MARQAENTGAQCAKLIDGIRNGVFAPVYLLMGDEPYYPELVCKAILDNCIDEFSKDFNETVCYGADVTAAQVVTAARRYPMMSERQLVVVKEAQLLKDLENLAVYASDPMDSTVLVILMHKASADKRKAFYKAVSGKGVVVDSPSLRDYEIPRWIQEYYSSKGLSISPEAAALLGESVGTEISVIVAETEKMLKNLPENVREVSVEDIERNVGVSRQFSIFELTRELSMKNSAKAIRIATHIGTAAKFQMPMAVSALYTHFSRILRYGALLSKGGYASADQKAVALAGVNPYFYREYDTAVRNYPVRKAMDVISLLCEYDYLGKGGGGCVTDPADLLTELTVKILNI